MNVIIKYERKMEDTNKDEISKEDEAQLKKLIEMMKELREQMQKAEKALDVIIKYYSGGYLNDCSDKK